VAFLLCKTGKADFFGVFCSCLCVTKVTLSVMYVLCRALLAQHLASHADDGRHLVRLFVPFALWIAPCK
jgi:hypothetical protein